MSLLTREKLPLGAVLALSVLIAGCDRHNDAAGQPSASADAATSADAAPAALLDRSHKGTPLPAVTVKDAAGKALSLPSLKGAPVLVNLWATWCGPCVKELPDLARLAGSGRIRVVTISQDMGDPAKASAFIAAKGGGRLPGWLDPDNAASSAFGVQTLPASVLFDASGHEVWRVTGGRDWGSAESATLVAEAK